MTGKKALTERENFFIAYNHKKPAWVPNFYEAYAPMGASVLNNQGDYMKGGKDMFGAKWICTEDTGWQAIPDPYEHVLEDITEWKKYIEFPDLDAMDWEGAAARDLARVDRNEKVVACFGMEGNFNRLQSLMGTCEALIAMLEEPEAVYEFFEAHTKFKMKTIEKIAYYYKPDIYVNGDDVCSGDGLFFSKAMYDDLIKPFEMMLGKTAVNCGLILEHHVCGNAEAIIPDIVETGATVWQTAQIMNDLNKIKADYGDRLLIHGGWDSTGPHNFEGASEESVRQATRKAIDDYGKDGNFALFPIVMGDPAKPDIARRRFWVCDECHKYSEAMYR
ncbi:MAG: hypothetical protein KHX56_10170 [Clostridiales bacterium]|nr:hypothetical protein [Clostridiales bacterium]